MTKEDDIREMKAMVAEVLNAADDFLDMYKGEPEEPTHYHLVRWLKPQAQDTLNRLRKGELLAPESEQMLVVQTLDIVLDHFDRMILDTIDEMSDEEYEEMMNEVNRN